MDNLMYLFDQCRICLEMNLSFALCLNFACIYTSYDLCVLVRKVFGCVYLFTYCT